MRMVSIYRHYQDATKDPEFWPDFMNWLPSDMGRIGFGYVYRCYDKDGRLLYVGKTNSPRKRMVAHSHNSVWYDLVDTTTWDTFEYRDLLHEEAHAIKTEHPIWNIQHNKGSKK